MNNLLATPHQHAPRRIGQEWFKAAVLLGLGLYLVYIIASGNLANYVNVRFAWLSYVAAGLFLVLGLAQTVSLLGKPRPATDPYSHDHEHTIISWPAMLVVAIPLALGLLIPSRPLGSAAVAGNISINAAAVSNASTAFTSDPLQWNVLDWLRAFHNSTDMNSFNGKQADVIGFVYREASFPKNQFMVARFAISCCVADASAIGLPVTWDKAGDFPADTWIRVKGTFQVGDFRGDTAPILMADSIEKVSQPAHPYLYP
jgi:uncharacterized repeat protein (TIGR03943 family)